MTRYQTRKGFLHRATHLCTIIQQYRPTPFTEKGSQNRQWKPKRNLWNPGVSRRLPDVAGTGIVGIVPTIELGVAEFDRFDKSFFSCFVALTTFGSGEMEKTTQASMTVGDRSLWWYSEETVESGHITSQLARGKPNWFGRQWKCSAQLNKLIEY